MAIISKCFIKLAIEEIRTASRITAPGMEAKKLPMKETELNSNKVTSFNPSVPGSVIVP